MPNKSHGRQSNLFAFFQKKAKNEPIENEQQNYVENDRENFQTPQRKRTESARSPASDCRSKTPLKKQLNQPTVSEPEGKSRADIAESHAVFVDSEEEGADDSCGVGFLSCASLATPSSAECATTPKRRRVILSSDEEGEEEAKEKGDGHREAQKGEETTAERQRQPTKRKRRDTAEKGEREGPGCETPTSTGRAPGNGTQTTPSAKCAQSFINSFSIDSPNASAVPSPISSHQTQQKDSKNHNKKDQMSFADGAIGDEDDTERFPHLDFDFLRPDKIKDGKGRRPNHPEFDERTLFVPEHFLKSQTPGHRQWWKLKSEHFDTIIFFKVGKFYELYHMDAVVAVENLGLVYMRGKYAHCGFPEIGYGKFADQLVNRGFKVARVEQTETPQQLADRQNKATASQEKDKVVRREICRVTTRGTKTYGVQDGTDSRELDGAADPNPNYLMALAEKVCPSGGSFRYGVCFVDCSVAAFKLAEFDDDSKQSNLRTLLAHNYPAQLLYEKGALSSPTMALVNTMLSAVPKEALLPKRQFMSAETTLKTLCDDNYFGAHLDKWPLTVRQMLASPEAAIPAPSECHRLCLSSLGAVLCYLKHCLVDVDTVSMRQFSEYFPPSVRCKKSANGAQNDMEQKSLWEGKHMVLDGVALSNLHIVSSLSLPGLSSSASSSFAVPSSRLSSANFSLYNTVNRCQTPFGKRLLRQWISAPICDQKSLLGRQKSVEWLLLDELRPNLTKMVDLLRKIPDLERLFQRIHTIGLKYRMDSVNGHPDSRANLFEADKYNKRKIKDLLIVLDGLEDTRKLMLLFMEINSLSESKAPPLLNECLSAHYKEMVEDLAFFKEAFDRENALERGVILPRRGIDSEYDGTCHEIEQCKHQLAAYLDWASKKLKCTPKFVGTGRNSHQLEIPESACHNLTDDFQFTSQRKGFKRYTTNNLQKLVDKLNDAETNCATISAEVTRRVFADLDMRKDKWASVVHQIATFDCLMALSLYAQSSPHKMCFPEFVFEFDSPFIDIQRGFHPSLADLKSPSAGTFNYIPNSCVLGCGPNPAHTMLLTGPNMGGKSTFMRQVAVLVALAHIGSMVPADSMRLTPVDRIFCRIGASDRLSAGQSTFFVELSETNTILSQATPHSLVLIDELGRGTSTHDGTAIACAVLKHIVQSIGCRTLFSTHYHSLCTFVANDPRILLAHMACMVENADLADPTMESITFLYSLAEGMCDKSYGFYTAKMAGLSSELIRRASHASNLLDNKNGMEKNA